MAKQVTSEQRSEVGEARLEKATESLICIYQGADENYEDLSDNDKEGAELMAFGILSFWDAMQMSLVPDGS